MYSEHSLQDVMAITATVYSGQISHWVHLTFSGGPGKLSTFHMRVSFPTRDIADAYANAINYANASTAVQTHHDKRLSDAGIQEYRDMMANIPENV